MTEPKVKCKKCGTDIMQMTADSYDGCCVPCSGSGTDLSKYLPKALPPEEVVPAENPKPVLDRMLIEAFKDDETQEYLDYLFSANISDHDPRFENSGMVVGHSAGLLRMWKNSGEIELLYPMPGDERERRFHSISHILRRHRENGEYPDQTGFASG